MRIEKKDRMDAIRAVIAEHRVGNQEELVALLKARGFETTQATLSRDMKELHIVKSPTPEGTYVYRLPVAHSVSVVEGGYRAVHPGYVSIRFANHLAVIKTRPGYASSIASEIDINISREIIGTIAGDDTILLIPCEGITHDAILDSLQTIIPNVKENEITQ